jgi:Uma2 family endonuclease
MAIATGEVQYTPEEILAIDSDGSYELVDGQLVERPLMGAEANLIASELSFRLKSHVKAGALGVCFGENCPYQCFPHDPTRVRKPDASFVRTGRLPGDKVPRGSIRIVPDLVIEVVSPTDLAEDLDERLTDYLRAGVPLVWVVYPKTRHGQVYRPDGRSARVGPDGEMTGDDVVPGFACRLADLFAVL